MDGDENRPYHALRAIPDIDRRILQGIAAGKSLAAIAREYGVRDTAILRRAQKYPEYREALQIGVELRMDQREAELEAAQDNVSVTRADRLLGHARWIAERACPERFGGKGTNVQINISTGSIDQVLSSEISQIIDSVGKSHQSAVIEAEISADPGADDGQDSASHHENKTVDLIEENANRSAGG